MSLFRDYASDVIEFVCFSIGNGLFFFFVSELQQDSKSHSEQLRYFQLGFCKGQKCQFDIIGLSEPLCWQTSSKERIRKYSGTLHLYKRLQHTSKCFREEL